jgi:hypothetical protein
MKTKILLLCASAVLLAGGVRLLAHHSFTAAYDSTKRVTIEGVVKEFVWRNPHSYVRIDITTKEGTTENWTLEWGSSNQLSAAKYPVTRTTLKAGDKVIANGEPGRDPEARRVRIFTLKRPVDGWQWEGVVD